MEFIKPRLKTLVLAIAAGAAIALGGLLFLLAKAFIPAESSFSGLLLGAFLFPVGLLLVCFFRLNLYTGKIGVALRNPNLNKLGLNTFEWLLLIYIGNVIGAFLVGLAFFGLMTAIGDNPLRTAADQVAASRNIDYTFMIIFDMIWKSILCGALVYIAVYLFGKLDSIFGKVIGVVIPIAFFVLAGFQHCVANMFYMAAGGYWTLNSFVCLLIVTVGNSVGALLLDLIARRNKKQ